MGFYYRRERCVGKRRRGRRVREWRIETGLCICVCVRERAWGGREERESE